MHPEARHFMSFVKNAYPESFTRIRILDVGSGDINGNNRFLCTECEYHGNDVVQAPNVTIVSKTKDLDFPDEYFDTIISTECFEHDPEYRESLSRIYEMLKPGGLLAFTCASSGRPEHGTRRTSPMDSYGTRGNIDGMTEYYKNLTHEDVCDVYDIPNMFSWCRMYYNASSHDLYFIGCTMGQNSHMVPKEYKGEHVIETYRYQE